MRLPWWVPFGRVPEIAPRALEARLNQTPAPQLVDVRTHVEFVRGHVRGAVNVPVTELLSKLDTLNLDPARAVVAICLTAHRSIPAVRLLRDRGFDAMQLSGGMLAVACREAAGNRGLSRRARRSVRVTVHSRRPTWA